MGSCSFISWLFLFVPLCFVFMLLSLLLLSIKGERRWEINRHTREVLKNGCFSVQFTSEEKQLKYIFSRSKCRTLDEPGNKVK